MKVLTIIRHAKSSWKEPALPDRDRPLSPRGKRDAPMMGRRLVGNGAQPDLVMCSPARRAVATMKKISREIGFPEQDIILDSRIYEADSCQLLHLVREIGEFHDEVILCGHNPGLTEFCNMVSDSRIDNIPTCGVVSLLFRLDSWRDITPHSGKLHSFDFPKKVVEAVKT